MRVTGEHPRVLLVGPGGDRGQPHVLGRYCRLMRRPPARLELPHRDRGQDEGDERVTSARSPQRHPKIACATTALPHYLLRRDR